MEGAGEGRFDADGDGTPEAGDGEGSSCAKEPAPGDPRRPAFEPVFCTESCDIPAGGRQAGVLNVAARANACITIIIARPTGADLRCRVMASDWMTASATHLHKHSANAHLLPLPLPPKPRPAQWLPSR
ncbi:MAG: hypothetical protein ACPIOQ_68530, partial [Promethearchaeia archaeon]